MRQRILSAVKRFFFASRRTVCGTVFCKACKKQVVFSHIPMNEDFSFSFRCRCGVRFNCINETLDKETNDTI